MDRETMSKKNVSPLTEENRMSDAQIDEELELCNEPGLASAMHDIQTLAKSYQQAKVAPPATEALELGGVSMTPNFWLAPTVAPRRESWKGIALGLMVMLGLSTSALALSLYNNASASETSSAPRMFELDTATLRVAPDTTLSEQARPYEPAIYRVATAPGVTASPEAQRESLAPPAISTRTTNRKASANASRITQSESCDEVACLIDGSGECCQQFESVRAKQVEIEEAPARPYRLTRSEIMKPMQSISGRVARCAETFGAQDVAMVKLNISEQGTITTLHVDHGSPGFQSCVEEQVRTLRFRELSQPFQFSYPFSL